MKARPTIILATHRVSYVYLADRLVVLKAGAVTADGSPTDISLRVHRQRGHGRSLRLSRAASAGQDPAQSLLSRSANDAE